MQQRQHFGGAFLKIFMRLSNWLPDRMLAGTWIRSSFILTPYGDAHAFGDGVRALNQLFFASVSGSVTRTLPHLRFRMTCPVWHQVRLFCHA